MLYVIEAYLFFVCFINLSYTLFYCIVVNFARLNVNLIITYREFVSVLLLLIILMDLNLFCCNEKKKHANLCNVNSFFFVYASN